MKRIMVFGAYGQAGTEFLRRSRGIFELFAPRRDEVDLEVYGIATAVIQKMRVDAVVNFAAFHNLDQCERDFGRALNVNARAVYELAVAARDLNALFVTVSTDYVFDGRSQVPYHEHDAVGPLQAYGASKVAGEFAALSAYPEKTIIIRTCGLYGNATSSKGPNFITKRLNDASRLPAVEVGSDLVCNPTSASAFCDALIKLLCHRSIEPGIYHLAADGECTWAEFTAAIYKLAGVSSAVIPVRNIERSECFRRPRYSVLGNSHAKELGIVMPSWNSQLSQYMAAKLRSE